MAGVCSVLVDPCGKGHRHVTVVYNGVSVTITGHVDDTPDPLTAQEVEQFVRLAYRDLRWTKNIPIANFLNRVLLGEEATNVKLYNFVAPGSAVTLTDIGTVYRNILPGDGVPIVVDCTALAGFKFQFNANLIAAGAPYRVRIVRASDLALFYESPSISATGEQGLMQPSALGDFITAADLGGAWPSWATGFELLLAQLKGNNATADPVVRRLQLGVR